MRDIAYLILAHTDPQHLARLTHSLSYKSSIYIHLDKKSNINEFRNQNFPKNVTFLENRVSVSWAAHSQVEATLLMMTAALDSGIEFSHMVLLSGLDYPIKPIERLHKYLNSNPNREFIRFFEATSSCHYRVFFEHYWFLETNSWLPTKLDRSLRHGIGRILRLIVKKTQPDGNKVYWGSAYWALTTDCVKYILDYTEQNLDFVKWAKSSFAPDEHYFHTIIGNSKFFHNSDGCFADQGNKTYLMANLHVIHESMRKIYTHVDFEELIWSDKFFVRKVMSIPSSHLLMRLDSEVLKIEKKFSGELKINDRNKINQLKVAVIMTCFNRKDKTASCLKALIDGTSRISDKVKMHIIVTDDGSSDGTLEMIQNRFPQVEVLHGDGNLYWNGGMRLAYGKALETKYDFYLWVNDDTILFPDFLERLLVTHEEILLSTGKNALIVGSTCDGRGNVTYGGLYRLNPKRKLKFSLVQPSSIPIPCESNNGNCLLISAEAARQLGNLEASYSHGMGDMDYGLRATKAGIPLWVMPGFVGECSNDHFVEGSYLDISLPFLVRWKKAISVKELNPRSWAMFCRRHAGLLWPFHWAWPYVKIVLTSIKYKVTSSIKV